MEVKFLKAGTGDSILIHHEGYNILVDGGNDSTRMLRQVREIYNKGEFINLLIITHHDDDHIRGIIDLLEVVENGEYGEAKEFIKKIFFNSPRKVLEIIPSKKESDKFLSYRQSWELEELLYKQGLDWETCTGENLPIEFEGLKIEFLSPDNNTILKYSKHKKAYLASDFKCDWKVPMFKLEQGLTDKNQDKSLPNKSSIVIKLECDDKKVLLTGDITPDRFELIMESLAIKNNGNPVKFDYIKLPHHGSYTSLNENIMKNIDCSNYIFSTNGKKYYHPNKRTIIKVSKGASKERLNFIFNYEEAMNNLHISSKEMKDYNFVLTPNNKDYGFNI